MIVVGIGCRRGCPEEEILSLIEEALQRAGLQASALNALAAPACKTSEKGILEAAQQLGLPLLWQPMEALRAVCAQTLTHSARVAELTGVGSIAEAAALAAAGLNARLVMPRIKAQRSTCAIAVGALA